MTPGRFLPPDEIEREKAASLARLFESWANLEERYTRDLEEDDIVDLSNMTVIKDRGVLASSPVKQFGMRQALLDDGDDALQLFRTELTSTASRYSSVQPSILYRFLPRRCRAMSASYRLLRSISAFLQARAEKRRPTPRTVSIRCSGAISSVGGFVYP